MRTSWISVLPVAMCGVVAASAAACSNEPPGSSPDGEDDVGVVLVGKADGEAPSECQLGAVVTWLNEGPSEEELVHAGVHRWASRYIVEARDGPDGKFGTDDDLVFTDVAEVDDLRFVGPIAIEQLVDAVRDRCGEPAPEPELGLYAEALDVDREHVTFPEGTPGPDTYRYPRVAGFGLGGTEFWQRWSGGRSPIYVFSEGTENGRRCMMASALRFEAMMANPPEELIRLRDETRWTGRFFNWNDDYTEAFYEGRGATLWAWRTGLIKWISQTNRDGTCELPTRELVQLAATRCLAAAESNGDEQIEGCRAP